MTLLFFVRFSEDGRRPVIQWQIIIPYKPHHLPALIYGFSGGKKNIKFYFPATTEQNIARVNLFRKPSNSSILMAIVALVTIRLIHLLW